MNPEPVPCEGNMTVGAGCRKTETGDGSSSSNTNDSFVRKRYINCLPNLGAESNSCRMLLQGEVGDQCRQANPEPGIFQTQ